MMNAQEIYIFYSTTNEYTPNDQGFEETLQTKMRGFFFILQSCPFFLWSSKNDTILKLIILVFRTNQNPINTRTMYR